jgi:hypothetical protein
MVPKPQATKQKLTVGIHQTKKILTAKETLIQCKRQPREWNNVFANHVSEKELISKVHMKLI